MHDFVSLMQQCAPAVSPATMQAIVKTESSFNPFAIGVVGGHLEHQPRTQPEAEATVRYLELHNIDYSAGISQINRQNFARYNLTHSTAFDPCANLRAGSDILMRCYRRAAGSMGPGEPALHAAISCYYSGNFSRGQIADRTGDNYVQRVVANAQQSGDGSISSVPPIPVLMGEASAQTKSEATSRKLSTSVSQTQVRRSNATHPAWDAFGEFNCDSDQCK